MRLNKAVINVIVNILTFLLGLLPSFIVRKVFLDSLGNELLGISSLYTNILGLLSLAELGIGEAIIYSLYKPFAEDNKEKVKAYLNYYSKFYRIIGCVIFGLGITIIPFLHSFIKNEVNLLDAQLYFVLFLVNTFISYLFSYKLCMLNVAQEEYKVSIVLAVSKLIISVLQLGMLKTFPNFYWYLFIQIFINILYYLVLNVYINNRYPWIRSTIGNISLEEKKTLVKNIKALFLHKIGGFFVFGTDNLVISYYINLTIVGMFNSYYMVIGAAQAVISNAISGVTASIGNLLVDGTAEDAYKVHKRLFFINFWIVSLVTISLFNTLKQFVQLWLGEKQVIDQLTIILVLINFYIFAMRGSVEKFADAGGVFHQDRFASLFESAINLVASIILAKSLGLPGVFLGTLISNLSVIIWIKPKMVYKYVFKKKLSGYFRMYCTFLFIGLIPLVITYIATMRLKEINSTSFVANCITNLVLINLIYLFIFRKSSEFIYFRNLAWHMLKKIGGVKWNLKHQG